MSVDTITDTRQYLSFKLCGEEFALDIAKVREVLDYPKITRVPQTPDFVRGVINLRGAVVPVVDLNKKFKIEETQQTVNTRVIIGEVDIDGDTIILGVLADSVHEVMEIEPTNIEAPPKIGTRLNTEFLKGMGKRDEEFILILDIDKVFSAEELLAVGRSSDGSAAALEASA